MLHTARARRGMFTAPHHLAAQSGLAVLREGGNAVEAMIAGAATIAAVYPHMNSIGGDSFWLISVPGRDPIAIDACGSAGSAVSIEAYTARGHSRVPARGPLAANTVAGTVSGWQRASELAVELGGTLARERLLEEAIWHAAEGVAVTSSQVHLTRAKHAELAGSPGFERTFLPAGAVPAVGEILAQPRLAETLKLLARRGFQDFYSGELARCIDADLARAGCLVSGTDLAAYAAERVTPLHVRLAGARVYNLPPPTQGLASLLILGIFEKLGVTQADGFDFVHSMVESVKQSFLVRDAEVTDPAYMRVDAQTLLSPEAIASAVASIDPECALPWPAPESKGDTIWMGAIDGNGVAVSFIQSIYWEFGSGVVLDESGILWQNRGSSFALDPSARQALTPGRKPFHTLNPALAQFDDGRILVYGTMGGEGQPQTQAALFSRYAHFGAELQAAITAPRWLLGRTWGEESTTLKLEDRFDEALVSRLVSAGHAVEIVEPFTELMGHAGAIVRTASGVLEGASDPRSDGAVAAF